MTDNQKVFIKELADISKKGLDIIDELDKFIKTKMSYCFSSMDFLCENYKKVYDSAQDFEKYLLDNIGIENLTQEKNIIDCTFQLEKNFSLTKTDSKQMLETITKGSNELTFDVYYNLYNYTCDIYENLFEQLGKITNKFEDINDKFNEVLESAEENIIILAKNGIDEISAENIIAIKDFCLKADNVGILYKNFMEAGEFVLSDAEEDMENCYTIN